VVQAVVPTVRVQEVLGVLAVTVQVVEVVVLEQPQDEVVMVVMV
jgi:hypothetical protein